MNFRQSLSLLLCSTMATTLLYGNAQTATMLTVEEKKLYKHITTLYNNKSLVCEHINPAYDYTQIIDTLAKQKDILLSEITQEKLYRAQTDKRTQVWNYAQETTIGAVVIGVAKGLTQLSGVLCKPYMEQSSLLSKLTLELSNKKETLRKLKNNFANERASLKGSIDCLNEQIATLKEITKEPWIMQHNTSINVLMISGVALTSYGLLNGLYKLYRRRTFFSSREQEIAKIDAMTAQIQKLVCSDIS